MDNPIVSLKSIVGEGSSVSLDSRLSPLSHDHFTSSISSNQKVHNDNDNVDDNVEDEDEDEDDDDEITFKMNGKIVNPNNVHVTTTTKTIPTIDKENSCCSSNNSSNSNSGKVSPALGDMNNLNNHNHNNNNNNMMSTIEDYHQNNTPMKQTQDVIGARYSPSDHLHINNNDNNNNNNSNEKKKIAIVRTTRSPLVNMNTSSTTTTTSNNDNNNNNSSSSSSSKKKDANNTATNVTNGIVSPTVPISMMRDITKELDKIELNHVDVQVNGNSNNNSNNNNSNDMLDLGLSMNYDFENDNSIKNTSNHMNMNMNMNTNTNENVPQYSQKELDILLNKNVKEERMKHEEAMKILQMKYETEKLKMHDNFQLDLNQEQLMAGKLLEEEGKKYESQMSAMQNVIKQFQMEAEDKTLLNHEQENFKQELVNEISNLEQEYKLKMKETERELAEKAIMVKAVTTENMTLSAKVEEMEKVKDMEIEKLKQENEKLNKELIDIQGSKETLENDMKTKLENERTRRKTDVLEMKETMKRKAVEQFEVANQQYLKLQELLKKTQEEVKSLHEEVKTTKVEVTKEEKKNVTMIATIDKLKMEMTAMEGISSSKEIEMQAMKNSYDSQLADLKEKLATSENERCAIENDKSVAHDSLCRLLRQHEELKKKHEDTTQICEELLVMVEANKK